MAWTRRGRDGSMLLPAAPGGPFAKAGGTVLALVVLAVFPLVFPNPLVTTIAVYCVIYMTAATAWNFFSGSSGYVSLGHAVFFGGGAYTMALMSEHLKMNGSWSMFALMLPAGAVAAGLALVFGFVALRVRRHTFVVITIAIFFITQLLAFNLGFTNGSAGVMMPNGQFSANNYNDPFYYVGAAALVLTVALSVGIRRSRFGLQLLSIRDDEDRARSLGVRVGRVKLTAFVLSAIPVGMVGALWAFFVGQIYPQFAFNPQFDVTVALMSFIGGFGTLLGPLLGSLVLESLQRYLTITFANGDLYLIVYGVLFLAVIVLLPDGVLPTLGRAFRRRRQKALTGTAAGAADGARSALAVAVAATVGTAGEGTPGQDAMSARAPERGGE